MVGVACVSAGAVDVLVGATVVEVGFVAVGSRSMFFASPTAAGSEICCACEGSVGAPPSVLEWGGGPGGGGGKPSSAQFSQLVKFEHLKRK